MSYLLSTIGNDQFLDSNGNPLAGGKLFTYLTGTSTKAATYTDNTGGTNQTNPIVLNSSGFPTIPIYLDTDVVYKFVLAPATDGDPPTSIIYTWNDVKVLDAVITVSEQWVVGTTPTFASTTSFTLVGDQTAIYHIGRRVKLQSTIATLDGTISASVFSSVTTITVVLDTSVLDATLNAVWYSILTAVNSSVPGMFSSGLDLTFNRDIVVTRNVTGTLSNTGPRVHAMTQSHNLIPVGTILSFAGAAAPTGYALCDGASVLRATYPDLFTAIGTTYGTVDGTHFNLPDLRGRAIIMVDGAANRITAASTDGANADTLGGVGGAETHTLVTAEMPAHTHTLSSNLIGNPLDTGSGSDLYPLNNTTSGSVGISSAGGGAAHSNTQPWIALNYMIRLY